MINYKVIKALNISRRNALIRIRKLRQNNLLRESRSCYEEYKEWIEEDFKLEEILFIKLD